TVSQHVILNVQQSFNGSDDISNISSDVLYYRLKVIGRSGEVKFSNIVIIRINKNKAEITIAPNPARNVVSVNFFTAKESEITMLLYDNAGKTMFNKKQKAFKGYNSIQLNNLHQYSNGVYELKILINDEVVVKKLIINN
ncbi:MAG: T9SS type A sorting domain-containing protein, partial [Ferruginibacter sp.]